MIELAHHILLLAGTVTPQPEGGGFSDGTWIIVALIGIIPAAIGYWAAQRSRREQKAEAADSIGLGYTKTAFASLERQMTAMGKQIGAFDHERDEWERDRVTWQRDKAELLTKISGLTHQVQQSNGYLQLLLMILDQHDITPPNPPSDLQIRRVK